MILNVHDNGLVIWRYFYQKLFSVQIKMVNWYALFQNIGSVSTFKGTASYWKCVYFFFQAMDNIQ